MRVFLLIVMLFCGMLHTDNIVSAATPTKVLVFNINGEIDGSSLALVKKAYETAEKEQVQAVVMQLDTFGGAVDAATKMRDIVLSSSVETICLVKHRAWSAGALLAISHNKIVMTDSASMGAAEPIPTTEKTVSALKAELAATAAKTGRNHKIAEAMVDKSLGYKEYAKPGQILSLTQEQAIKEGMADVQANDLNEAMQKLNITDPEYIHVEQTFRETLLGWLTNPFVKSLLITAIILGIFTEIKTAGTGVPGIIAVVAGVVVFGADIIGQSGNFLPVLVFILGVGLLVFEIFIPGFGLIGVMGTLCIVASFFLLLGGGAAALKWLALSFVVAVAGIYLLSKYLPHSSIYKRVVLKNTSGEMHPGSENKKEYTYLLGKHGVALTVLRPAGKIKVDNQVFDALSYGDFIDIGKEILVDAVQGEKIYVNKLEGDEVK